MPSDESRLDVFLERTQKYLNLIIGFGNLVVIIAAILNLASGDRLFFYGLAIVYLLVLVTTFLVLIILRERPASKIQLPSSSPERPKSPKSAAKIVLVFTTLASLGLVGFIIWHDYGGRLGPKVPDCTTSLGLSVTSTAKSTLDDEAQLRILIETEAEAVSNRDVSKAISIFREGAIVRDASGTKWEGCAEIQARYKKLMGILDFMDLRHDVVELKITGDLATAKTTVHAEYKLSPDIDTYALFYSGTIVVLPIDKAGERWNFIKSNGVWKVAAFTYGLPP